MTVISEKDFKEKYGREVGRKPKYAELVAEIDKEVRENMKGGKLPKGTMIIRELDITQSAGNTVRKELLEVLPETLKVSVSKMTVDKSLLQVKNAKTNQNKE